MCVCERERESAPQLSTKKRTPSNDATGIAEAARCYKTANAKVNRSDTDAIILPSIPSKKKEDNCNIVCMEKRLLSYIHRLKSIK